LCAASPELAEPLGRLSDEHDALAVALDELAGSRSARAAIVARDLVHRHLSHEEPVLFPALRTVLPAEEWEQFSVETVSSAPQQHAHLFVGLFHEVAAPGDVDVV